MPTNLEKWKAMMEWCPSPQSFIDWGFYYLISASLQRRVWEGPDQMRCFPNMYVILTAEPAVGKGLVINQVTPILKHWPLEKPTEEEKKNNPNDLNIMFRDEDYINAKRNEDDYDKYIEKKARMVEKPLLIPVAPDTSTFEALVHTMASSLRRINYIRYDPVLQRDVQDIYTHSSICFSLEELSSLFRKFTNDVVNFLIKVYDCNDYNKDTKTAGKDKVRRPCLNFLAGTTPDFMQEIFNDELLNQGFASRTFFIFANANRKTAFRFADLSEEQKQYKVDIINHVKKLTKLYGRVNIEESTYAFLEDWWANESKNRSNPSIRLNPYYGRKNIHIRKLAMALHFGETTDMTIPLSTFEKAIEILREEEKRMHYALGLDEKNPLAKPARKVEMYLKSFGKKTANELLAEFWNVLPLPQRENLDNILEHLTYIKKVDKKVETIKDRNVIFYSVPGSAANNEQSKPK